MNEEELKAKAEELERKEGDISKKEEELNARELSIVQREADASNIAETIKKEFEARLEKQKQEFEERLKSREDIIKQLASGETPQDETPSAFEEINKRRRAQKAA